MTRWWVVLVMLAAASCRGSGLRHADASTDEGISPPVADAGPDYSRAAFDPGLVIQPLDGITVPSLAEIATAESPGEALVVWNAADAFHARSWTAAAGWAPDDEVLDSPPADGAVRDLRRTDAGGYTLAAARMYEGDGGLVGEVWAADRGADGKWRSAVRLGSGSTGWWQDPSPPPVHLARDDGGQVALWPADETLATIRSSVHTGEVWGATVDFAGAVLYRALSAADGARAVVGLADGGFAILRRAADGGWGIELSGADATFLLSNPAIVLDLTGTVHLLRSAIDDTAVLLGNRILVSELPLGTGNQTPGSEVVMQSFPPGVYPFATLLAPVGEGGWLAAYRVGATQLFRLRSADGASNGSWGQPWALPDAVPTGKMDVTRAGDGWLLNSTPPASATGGPWQANLYRFTSDGRYGPGVTVAGGNDGLLEESQVIAVDDAGGARALVVAAVRTANGRTLSARWFRAP